MAIVNANIVANEGDSVVSPNGSMANEEHTVVVSSSRWAAMVHPLLLSGVEVAFSVANALEQDAFSLVSVSDYVFAASAVMEVAGTVFALLLALVPSWVKGRWLEVQIGERRIEVDAAEPVIMISSVVLEVRGNPINDDLTAGVTVLIKAWRFTALLLTQSLCNYVVFLVYLISGESEPASTGLVLFVIVLGFFSGLVAINGFRFTNTVVGSRRSNDDIYNRARWVYLSFLTGVPLSPVVWNWLEVYYPLQGRLSMSGVILIVTDIAVTAPAVLAILIQLRHVYCCKFRS